MKKLVTIATLLGFALLCMGNVTQYHSAVARIKAGAAGPTFLLEENFEETDTGGGLGSSTDGYDSALVSIEIQSAGGTVDPDYTTTPMQGSQMLALTSITGEDNYVEWDLGSEYSTLGIYLRYDGDTSTNRRLLRAYDSVGVTVFTVDLMSAARLRMSDGSTAINHTSGIMSTAHVWIDWVSGSSMSIGASSDGTKPTSGNYYASGTPTTGSIQKIRLLCENLTGTKLFDRLLVDDVAIGDSP